MSAVIYKRSVCIETFGAYCQISWINTDACKWLHTGSFYVSDRYLLYTCFVSAVLKTAKTTVK